MILNEPEAIRVLHCPTTVGGHPQQLARAERELGLRSVAVTIEQNYLDYATDEVLCGPDTGPWRRMLKRLALVHRARRDFDIVHYNFGSTILPQPVFGRASGPVGRTVDAFKRLISTRELASLRRAGKGIVVTYQGDDARQGDFCLANFEISIAHEVPGDYYTPRSDSHKRKNIARFAKYADQIYALNPDLLHVLGESAEFLPYAAVDLRDWTPPSKPAGRSERLTILHAPTHHGAKGTDHVLRAVALLKNEDHLDFNFRLVEGLSREDARRAYEEADLVIDQLLAGWYGTLAVEVMALGRPVICYLRQPDLKFIPDQMRKDLPVINATPTTLYEVMKQWLTVRKDDLPNIGRASRAYVEKWHDPLAIAARLKADYETMLASKRPGVHR